MAKREKTSLAGLNFRQMKKLLKHRAESKTLEVVSAMKISIRFSDEIAHWSDKGYYESPKFTEFWLRLNARLTRKQYRERYGHGAIFVAFYSQTQQAKEEALLEEGYIAPRQMRWLIIVGQAISISPQMALWNVIHPSRFTTAPHVLVQCLMNICEDCARFCGGTVTISVGQPQRLPFDGGTCRTFAVGKVKKEKTEQ